MKVNGVDGGCVIMIICWLYSGYACQCLYALCMYVCRTYVVIHELCLVGMWLWNNAW